ncbi:MAG: thiamine phosphate synthase [Sphingomonas sp.]|uniref:thiamine phosphate synthase n=1 Tax=Sphingomonas sp. TaxID=28214 RepID=UPI0035A83E55|nr:thiamine phosphate synthase [Sphingomonas sp.]
MRTRHPKIPTQWLMTDERMADGLWAALDRVPRGGGIIFRHYSLDRQARRALFDDVRRIARRRRLTLLVAGNDGWGWGSDGTHGRSARQRHGIKSWPAHNAREIIAGRRAGADMILVSPIFATRSHPGAAHLGIVRAAALAKLAPGRAIALGGVGPRQAKRLAQAGFQGWAAIDAWQSIEKNA